MSFSYFDPYSGICKGILSRSFCCFYYMEAEIKDDNFVCPHRLQKGISEARVGYWVVRKLLNMVELKK